MRYPDKHQRSKANALKNQNEITKDDYINMPKLSLDDISSADLPELNQDNIHLIANMFDSRKHPHLIVRATILLKLEPMIRAYIQFVHRGVQDCDSSGAL